LRFAPLLLLLFLIACQPVREDRTIEFSGDGKDVGFQHGDDGVYVADSDGKTLRKIHDPGKEVIATSTPLFAPGDKRLIFTTAKPADGSVPLLSRGFDPAGGLYEQQAVAYTCWLRDADGQEPRVLFRARCRHVGYVAANLAIRWHPSGDAVLFVDEDGADGHAVFRHDLESGRRTRMFPESAADILFDFALDGRLACVTPEGVHVQAEGGWWTIPAPVVKDEAGARIEALRARRPAFRPDGERFAFATRTGEKEYLLALATTSDAGVTTVARSDKPFRDLRWSRAGTLAYIEGSTLRLPDTEPVAGVRRFAGWNAGGDKVAYTRPDAILHSRGPLWSFLFAPEPLARDAVFVGGQEVFSGMRVTFPKWSPTEDKLSVWFTFSPTHRSMLSLFLGVGLRAGDPAAVFDTKSREIAWLAINSHEQEQVGHYWLLKGDPRKAWEWYERAAANRAAEPERGHGALPPDIELFESICLARLGRNAEAAEKRAAFERRFRGTEMPSGLEQYVAPLLADMYVAEVYCSLDSAAAGEADLRSALRSRTDAPGRLSAAIVLSQLLLLQGKHGDYAELMADAYLPIWSETRVPIAGAGLLMIGDLLALPLLPLMVREFVDGLPEGTRAALLRRWRAFKTEDRRVRRTLAFMRIAAGDTIERPPREREDAEIVRWVWLDDPDEAIRLLRQLLARPDDPLDALLGLAGAQQFAGLLR
jgi:hypothetical protein